MSVGSNRYTAPPSMRLSRFAISTWVLLAFGIVVILWGAYVRASGSGDGCGNHWPNCYDSLLAPEITSHKTWVEITHRRSTAIFSFGVLAILIGAFRFFPRGHGIRKAALATAFFTLTEGLIGALLVKRGLVTDNASAERAIVMAAHLVNTFILLGAMTLLSVWASGLATFRSRGQGAVGWAFGVAVFGTLLLGVSGAIAALGDTLFKAESVAEALRQDFSPTAHFLERLRPIHPLLAVSVGLFLFLLAGLVGHLRPDDKVKVSFRWLIGLFIAQLALGIANVFLNAPIWMQIVHLFVADLIWVALVTCGALAMREGIPRLDSSAPLGIEMAKRPFRETIGGYIVLTKPKVISLLLFTTLTAMFAAKGGWPGMGLFLAVFVGGYMAAGSANAINMVIDRDIDATMKRTRTRPVVTEAISSTNALLFAFSLAAGSFFLLTFAANLLTAVLALAGLAFYVVIYTLLLKRRTWHNIVIGGAAGAFPPLVGWASVTNDISPLAWYLFAIIFLWTPVHFWALALLIKEDYAEAGVPMLPVVHGDRATTIQIVAYAVLTWIVSLLPMLQPQIGWTYFSVAMVLNLVLVVRSVQLHANPDRPRAVSLYKFSMLYLALLFLSIAVDRAVWAPPS